MKSIALLIVLFMFPIAANAQSGGVGKLPLEKGPAATVWVNPNISTSNNAPAVNGGTMGATSPSGREGYVGVSPSGNKAAVSAGGSTGGNPSYSAGAQSDGKNSSGTVGVKISTP